MGVRRLGRAAVATALPAVAPRGVSARASSGATATVSDVYADGSWHVATTGSDANSGTSASPFLTIQRALTAVSPGEEIVVHGGTYRELLDPPIGGTSETARVTVRAAEGETVKVKGSERITSWTSLGGGRWQCVIPNSFFGSFNPYSLKVSGSYMANPGQVSRGCVYLNEVAYTEAASAGATTSEGLWYGSVDASNTTITAHFGGADPNAQLAEINVRTACVRPSTYGLKFLSWYGLRFMHAAPNWSDPDAGDGTIEQDALFMTRAGRAWVIERCVISDAKCSGVGFGLIAEDPDDFSSITFQGGHTVRYCTIERCGQAAINGSHGAVQSVIEHCLIQDINVGNVFGGYEIAGLKFHTAIDMTIKNNVIRRVYQNNAAGGGYCPGIWIDWQAQGTRITGNVIYDIEQDRPLVVEACHGPTLIDNNVFDAGVSVEFISEANVLAHNLLRSGIAGGGDPRTPRYWVPHTKIAAGTASLSPNEDRYINNIYVGGVSAPPNPTGGTSGYHVVYDSGSTSGSTGSVSVATAAGLNVSDLANGATVSFTATAHPGTIGCPVVGATLVGTFTLPAQSIENPDGTPITIDTDAMGVARGSSPKAGPFQNVAAGLNAFTFFAGVNAP